MTPFCVTGPRDEDGIIVLMRGGRTDWGGRSFDPLQPKSIWWKAVNELANVLCPVRDTHCGRCAKETVEVLLSLPSFLFSLSLTRSCKSI